MFLGFQVLHALIRRLPMPAVRTVGQTLGLLAYVVLRSHRRLTHQHLRFAFGEQMSAAMRRRIARRVFMNLGQSVVEWLALPTLSSGDLQQLITCEGLEHLRQVRQQGNGVIMVSAHFGNWELVPMYLSSLGFEGGVLARRLRYPEYESFLISMRGEKGVPTFARGSLKEMATLLRANQVVGMLPDQDMDSLEGVFVEFFGRPTYTPVGPAALSVLTGAPIVPCFVIREGGRFRLVIEPPVRVPEARDRTQAVTALTQAWSAVMESYIRRYPDHWVWMHRRWKTRPSEAALGAAPPIPQGDVGRDASGTIPLQAMVTSLLLLTGLGCAKRTPEPPATTSLSETATQALSGFTLTGYEASGAKRWTLNGRGASLEETIVTIQQPDAVGYDPGRTAYFTASAAQVEQVTRHVRLEHDVVVHTTDGVWLATPILHWIPDQDRLATDQPVMIETDHMLLHGRGLEGQARLKHAKVLRDVEMVLNPNDQPATREGDGHVTITCDGPLSFDYERHIATFEQNVHVDDPNGEIFSDTLVAYFDPATRAVRYAEALGSVRLTQGQHTAVSDKAVYEPGMGKITLVGRPSLLIYPASGGEGLAAPGRLVPPDPGAPPPGS